MTVNRASPRAKPRWLSLALFLLCLTAISAGVAAGHGVTTLPTGYVGSTAEDVHGANDVPGQVDVTLLGRDNTQAPDLRIFWSWDSISAWTGTGQTGDACALFDTSDADVFINYVVCARVENKNADPANPGILVMATDKPVFLFDCSNKKIDRCTNPVPRPYNVGQVLAGPLGSLSTSGAGNLLSHLDPFDELDLNGPGESYPHDTSIDIKIAAALVPSTVSLVNVCSYPSAGNGGNNNPFDCIFTPGTLFGTLRVTKVVNNNNGGTATAPDFSFDVTGGVANDTAFEADGSNDFLVPVGSYSVTENAATNYTASYGNSLNANANCNNLTVSVGVTTICTITNSDNPPSLTLVKQVTTDNGGSAAASAWTLQANKQGTSATPELTGTTGVSSGATFGIGTYDLSETGGPTGYEQTSLTCSDSGSAQVTSVTLSLGESVTCTFVNNDKAPSLTLVKQVVNDNGGDAVAGDWTLTATGYDASSPDAGSYDLSESGGPAGYTQTSLTCDNSTGQVTSVTLALDEDVTCTFVNDDLAPGLTLIKHVVNDNGGTAVASAWTLSAGTNNVAGSESGNVATMQAGTYALSESSVTGYTNTSITCDNDPGKEVTSVTLGLGQTIGCTFVNDDDAPSLTLVKSVVNDNGGTAVASQWTLFAGTNSVTGSASGVLATDQAGTYALSESAGPDGYDLTSITCTDSGATPVTSVTVSLGEDVTCTFVNDDQKATPGIATDVDAQIRDNVRVTGRGTPGGTVDFYLFSDDQCSIQVGTQLNVLLDSNGEATSDWFEVSSSDTYYWRVDYDGDQNNAAATGSCGEAITVTSADFASVLTGAGLIVPVLAWAVWSRRRRDLAL